ncbi:MAG: hypothetical protein UX30_C0006G0024 [Candidatus Saccharibacteria bacterium GW2011_GWA2_46_10]|nr:MAG: hypothetical protein UX30_C0006G0024 [Candidatus Saccharibacteria bacterium GW2011_GWA2_46_10]OGL36212.1 MAG: hypothetical protein A3F05_02835 [Candidatus Saccharibacteria bacterium RIFCSPHIGHO2_12_FULL_47_17]
MRNNHTGRKLAIGTLIAGAAGYISGLLTAPKSGKETRKDLADKADELKDQAAEELKKASDELSDLIKAAKDKSLALGAQARGEFNEAVIRAKDARNKAGHVIKAVKNGVSDEPQLNAAMKQVKQARKNLARYLRN